MRTMFKHIVMLFAVAAFGLFSVSSVEAQEKAGKPDRKAPRRRRR